MSPAPSNQPLAAFDSLMEQLKQRLMPAECACKYSTKVELLRRPLASPPYWLNYGVVAVVVQVLGGTAISRTTEQVVAVEDMERERSVSRLEPLIRLLWAQVVLVGLWVDREVPGERAVLVTLLVLPEVEVVSMTVLAVPEEG